MKGFFYELYELLDDLNDKRNKFRHTHRQAYAATDRLLNALNDEMNKTFSIDESITGNDIRIFCSNSIILINKQKAIFERHRGIWGILDGVLTILASLIVLYPAVYLYQRYNNTAHTFFNTDSGIKAQNTIVTLNKINDIADNFSEDGESSGYQM